MILENHSFKFSYYLIYKDRSLFSDGDEEDDYDWWGYINSGGAASGFSKRTAKLL